nr:hypothetical protein [Kibdelosporangium sp. MJ126-NF4]CEL19121.1 Twin-arginine translocation protein TatA [Kibdelosporangium sp. MJ126-NF4]CTQ95077.1 Twin-arginine translocation protein TatA [Kibdelosporangium sp. MJ126-NF4]
MSYPQQGGYPQQPYPQQQPYQAAPSGGGNPATAIIAGLLALAVAGFATVVLVNMFDAIGGREMPGEMITIVSLYGVGGLLLLVGAILTFLRKVAGAVLIIIGAIVGLAAMLTEPLLMRIGVDYGVYMEFVFQFEQAEGTFRALTLIVAPLALIVAVLPPTFKYLRGSSNDGYASYGGYPQQPGYPVDPNSGGFPQQGYPANPGSGGFPQQSYPQQGGYPQQQQGGGHPQQPGW